MTSSPSSNDPIRHTDEIMEKHKHWWREPAAKQELKELWGDAINDCGVFVDSLGEVLYDRDGCKAEISIATAHGVHAFGCSFQSPTQGYGGSPSISGDFYPSHGAARTAAIEYLIERLPDTLYIHEESGRKRVEQMLQHLAGLLAQPSLF